MGIITAISPQRRPGRFNVQVDNAFAVAVSEKVLVDLHLAVGDEIDEHRVGQALAAEDQQKALRSSLRLLESRQRSQKEIVDRLTRHGYSPHTVDVVKNKLTELGLVDDNEFATAWIDSRSRCQPSGRTRLKSELAQKGVDSDTITTALGSITEEEELDLARRALMKRSTSLPADIGERQKEYTRQADYLARRGFPWTIVRHALKERFDLDVVKIEQPNEDDE